MMLIYVAVLCVLLVYVMYLFLQPYELFFTKRKVLQVRKPVTIHISDDKKRQLLDLWVKKFDKPPPANLVSTNASGTVSANNVKTLFL